MGSVCCCLRPEDFEDYMNPSSNVYRNCMCLGCFVQNFVRVYTTLFRRGELSSVPSSIQGTGSIISSASLDNSLSDMYQSPPRPLPYDADTRYFRLQRDGLVSRHEKGSSHSHEESEPLRDRNDADSGSLITKGKCNAFEQGSKEQHSKSSRKLSSAKAQDGIGYIYSSAEEEEDVCPTCLDEYTPANPKIITKCSHHFHLGCIYEWMERSETCPVCGKWRFWTCSTCPTAQDPKSYDVRRNNLVFVRKVSSRTKTNKTEKHNKERNTSNLLCEYCKEKAFVRL